MASPMATPDQAAARHRRWLRAADPAEAPDLGAVIARQIGRCEMVVIGSLLEIEVDRHPAFVTNNKPERVGPRWEHRRRGSAPRTEKTGARPSPWTGAAPRQRTVGRARRTAVPRSRIRVRCYGLAASCGAGGSDASAGLGEGGWVGLIAGGPANPVSWPARLGHAGAGKRASATIERRPVLAYGGADVERRSSNLREMTRTSPAEDER